MTDKNLFGSGVFNYMNPMTTTVSQDLFAQPQTDRSLYRSPSRADLQARAAAEEAALLNGITQQFQGLMATPEWQNASLQRRNEIYDAIIKDQFTPFVQQHMDNPDLMMKLQMIPEATLKADINALSKQIDDANELGDLWRGMKSGVHQLSSGIADGIPSLLAADRVRTLEELQQRYGYSQERQNAIDAARQTLREQETDRQDTLKAVQELQGQQSIARRNTETRRRELQGEDGEFLGTLSWAAENPLDALSFAAEQAPTMIPTAAATVGGTMLAGPVGGAAAAAAVGGLFSAADAMGSAGLDLSQQSMDDFRKMPEFQALVAQGTSEGDARNQVIAYAQGDAGAKGLVIGALTNVFGPERILGGAIGKTITGATARSIANGTMKKALLRGAATTLAGAGMEGVEEGATQWASNSAINKATGLNNDVWDGVAEAAALGMIAGGPMSAVGGGVDTYHNIKGIREARAEAAARGETDLTTHRDVPSPEAAHAAEQGNTVDAATAVDPLVARTALNTVRKDLLQHTGTALTTAERDSLYATAYAAEQAGMTTKALQSLMEKLQVRRASPDGNDLWSGYQEYVSKQPVRNAQDDAPAEVPADTTVTRPSWAGAESMEHVAPLAQAMMAAYRRDSVAPQAEYTPMYREPFDATVRNLPRTPRGMTPEKHGTIYVTPEGEARLAGDFNGQSMEHVAPLARAMMAAYRRDSVAPQAEYTPMYREPFDATVRNLPRTPRGMPPKKHGTIYVTPEGGARLAGDFNGQSDGTGAATTGTGSTGAVAGVTAGDGGTTGTRVADDIAATTGSARTGAGRGRGDTDTANAVHSEPTDALGSGESSTAVDSGRSDSTVPGTSAAVSTGERSVARETGPRTTDGRGAESTGLRASGGDWSVGQTATYKPRNGAKAKDGVITAVNPDGTVDIEVQSMRRGKAVTETKRGVKASQLSVPERQQRTTTEPEQMTDNAATTADAPLSAVPLDELVVRMNRALEQMSDIPLASADVEAARNVAEAGDIAAANTMATDAWVEHGITALTPEYLSEGEGRTKLIESYRRLTPEEREEVIEMHDMLESTGDFEGNVYAFVTDGVISDLNEQANAEPYPFWQYVTDRVKELIRRVGKGIATALVGITLWNAYPVPDAHAATSGVVTQVQQVQGLSNTASAVRAWVQETKDNRGQKYIIADKVSGEMHIMDSRGNVLATMPALYGTQKGDAAVPGQTPAGIFTLQQRYDVASSFGGDVQQFAEHSDGSIWAIHRVLTSNPKQMRQARLNSPTAEDNRVSLGCINVPADMYNKYLKNGFKGKLYVIPEQRPLGEVFRGIQENVAADDLKQDMQSPASLDDTDTTAFRSSTDSLATEELQKGTLDSGALLTSVLSETDPDSLSAAKGNDAADLAAFFALPLAAGRMSRNAKKRRNARMSESVSDVEDREAITGTADTPAASPDNVQSDSPEYWASTARGRTLTPKQRVASLWFNRQSWMAPVVQRLYDSQYPMLRWISDNGIGQVAGEGIELTDNPIARALKFAPGKRDHILTHMKRTYMEPAMSKVVEIAQKNGVALDDAAKDIMTWISMRHVPEGNADLRRRISEEIDAAIAEGDETAIEKAVQKLNAHDAYQQGKGPRVEMVGGWTDAQARATMRKIEQTFSPEDMAEVAQHLYDALEYSKQQRIAAGVLSPEQVAAWPKFKYYVPMYMHMDVDGDNAFVGASAINPLPELARGGSKDHYAEHALMTVTQSLHRAAAAIAIQDFKAALNAQFQEQNELAGMQRVRITGTDTTNKPGIFFTEHTADGKTENYKFIFTDKNNDNIMASLFPKEQTTNPLLQAMATSTSAYARLLTKYRATFAPVNWFREGAERAVNLASRHITVDGKTINPLELQARIRAATLNPVVVASLAEYMTTGKNADNEYVKAYKELEATGALATINDVLKHNEKDIRKDLRRMKGLRKYAKQLDGIATHYNEVFGAAPAVAAYVTLKKAGVDSERAAMFILDTFNIHNSGTWTHWMRAFQPFIVPAMEGSRNLLRTMSTPRGWTIGAAGIATSIMLYTMLASLAPDDEMDKMSLPELSRYIPLYGKDGSFVKLPVAFGLPRQTWITGAAIARLVRGSSTPAEALSGTTASLAEELLPVTGKFSGDHASRNPLLAALHALTPDIMRPFVEVATNTSHFGTPIHGSFREGEAFASESGKTRTADVWKNAATYLRENFGIDVFPESIRHVINYYAAGALSGLTTWMENDSLYMSKGHMTTRQELGGFWTSVGLTMLYDNGRQRTERQYWRMQDKVDDLMKRYGVVRSDPGNGKGMKAVSAMQRMMLAGASAQEAMLVRAAIEADTARSKNNRALNDRVKKLRKAQLSPEHLEPMFTQHLDMQDHLMKMFIAQGERSGL
ncbi:LPD38 domain-containing protein [Escherichia coli]|uniref:LPD38 domain-containing protein n=1 Tax=Escherichia coli TaxID=562 RepID=UPI0012FE6E72|nr:LPD38 domain-containing protein [Escherichia coli]MVV97508.1 hypothetical protein [Escherichia coli]MWP11856.1 hypothetical protein [Escherichia coli]